MTDVDWLSYSLQDFLMFGPQVFLRLFIRLNQDIWPWQLLIVPLALVVPWLIGRPAPAWRRLAVWLVAAAWIGSGGGFLVRYFGEINWPAVWFGWAFVAQGLLMAGLGTFCRLKAIPKGRAGVFAGLWLTSVVVLPWVPVLQSGELAALAVFGLTPDVTLAASALVLAMMPRVLLWSLLPIPLLWVLFSAATFWALQMVWLLLLPAATLIVFGLSFWLSPSPAQSRDRQSVHRDPVRR